MDYFITSIALAVIGLWLGSIEIRIRNMSNELKDKTSRAELKEQSKETNFTILELKRDMKEDVNRIEKKIDFIISRQIKD